MQQFAGKTCLSRHCNDLRRLRRACSARRPCPCLPVYSERPLLGKLRNRLGLCFLPDGKSPVGESCGPSSPTDDWWWNLRVSQSLAPADRRFAGCERLSSSGQSVQTVGESGVVLAGRADRASRTDVSFLSISDHGKIGTRLNPELFADSPDGGLLSGVDAVAQFRRAVFLSKETGSDL